MRCLEIAGCLGLTRTICPTISRDRVRNPDMIALFDYATKNNIGVQPTIAMMVGNWRGHREIMLEPEEVGWLHEVYQQNQLIKRDNYNNFSYIGCPAFKTLFYVAPTGDVTPCPFIHITFGNLLEDSLEEITSRARKYDFFREFSQPPICLAGEDRKFIEKYLTKTFGEDTKLPVPYDKVFS